MVVLTGPRQAGRTTPCRASFPNLKYISLEAPDIREFARSDPRGFLASCRDGAVIDEVQHVPALMSYLQTDVDENPTPGRFILTGSKHFGLSAAISQRLRVDAGVTHNTARAWLSVLEASFLPLRLPAWHANIRKQVVKAPKLHLVDSGLLCYLFNIREPEQLRHHPLRGAIFETWVVSELYKSHLNRGERPDLYHYRESRGLEMDVLVNCGDRLLAIEAKSAATISPDFFRHFETFAERMRGTELPQHIVNRVVYGGESAQARSSAEVISCRNAGQILG